MDDEKNCIHLVERIFSISLYNKRSLVAKHSLKKYIHRSRVIFFNNVFALS